jgi:hypothetical protein
MNESDNKFGGRVATSTIFFKGTDQLSFALIELKNGGSPDSGGVSSPLISNVLFEWL